MLADTARRSSKQELEDLIKARYSLVYVSSHEEDRVEEALRRLCMEREMRLEVWSITEGFKVIANGTGTRDVKDPMKALDHVLRGEGRGLYILRDYHPFLKEPAVVRKLRDAASALRKTKKSLIMLSPVTKIPPELEKSVAAVLDWELPNRIEIEESARKATSFAVFEPNDSNTWLKVKGMLESYLYGLWEQGALQGATPEAAYYVNVGLGKTMTPQDVLEGRMIVEIAAAAVRPAEFIVLRFSHKLIDA